MKTLVLVSISLILMVACQDEPISEIFELNEEKVFMVNHEYELAGKNLQVKVTKIEDSRCPSDVVCVWQGEAKVTVATEQAGNFSTILSTYDNLIDTLGDYSIELISIQPYPVSDKVIKSEDYDVKLKINMIFKED